MHVAVADKIRANPALVSIAKANIQRWKPTISPGVLPYLSAWESLLDGDLDVCLSFAVERSERANAMRQASPFGGVLSHRERFAFFTAKVMYAKS